MLIIAGMIAFSAYQEKNHPIDPVPTLIQLLQDQNEWVRRNAAIALGKIGTPEAIKAMPALKITSPTRSNRRRRL